MYKLQLLIICIFVNIGLSAQDSNFQNRLYIYPYGQGIVSFNKKGFSTNQYDLLFIQNYMGGIGCNIELKNNWVLHNSIRLNFKKFEQDFKFNNFESEQYYNTNLFHKRNINIKSIDLSIGAGYKYQYGRNVIIPYLDIRYPLSFNSKAESFGLKEIGSNNYRIITTEIEITGAAFTYEVGADYILHVTKNGGFFGSLGFIYSDIPYKLTNNLNDNLYEDKVIENKFKLNESGFIISAGIFIGIGNIESPN